MFSPAIDNLIAELKKLPSVGQHTAERYVFFWLKNGKREVNQIISALSDILEKVKSCETCWTFSDTNPCEICSNLKRDQTVILVVGEPQTIPVVEQSGAYTGRYHCLRGVVDPLDPASLERLRLNELLSRLKTDKNITEVILALNPDMAGETTMLYLEKEIRSQAPQIKVTRLAKGLQSGSDLQYADENTLTNAIKNRHA